MNDKKIQRIEDFAQDVYLFMVGRKHDDIKGEDGQNYVAEVMSWLNILLDELESKADWIYLRENDHVIGTATTGGQKLTLADTILRPIINEHRPAKIMQGSARVAKFDIVRPDAITFDGDALYDRAALTRNNTLVFSRPFTEQESGGRIVCDVLYKIPRVSRRDVDVFDIVTPYRLLVLGVAKDVTLPSLIRRETAPALTKKFNDLLDDAINQNNQTSQAEEYARQSFENVRGVY